MMKFILPQKRLGRHAVRDSIFTWYLVLIVALMALLLFSSLYLFRMKKQIAKVNREYETEHLYLRDLEHHMNNFFYNVQFHLITEDQAVQFSTRRQIVESKQRILSVCDELEQMIHDDEEYTLIHQSVSHYMNRIPDQIIHLAADDMQDFLLEGRSIMEVLNSYLVLFENRKREQFNDLKTSQYERLFLMLFAGVALAIVILVFLYINIVLRKKREEQILHQKEELQAQNEQYAALNEEYLSQNEDLNKLNSLLQEQNKEVLEMNKALRLAKKKAEESDALKSSFLATISHEIRTPMNAILGFSSYLKEVDDAEKRKRYLDIIIQRGDDLLYIINDLLDISQIEAGQMKLHPRRFDVVPVLRNLYEERQFSSSLPIRFSVKPEMCEMETDEKRLRQVLNNLLTNAIQYTKSGYIELGMEEQPEALVFYVRDTGNGLSKEEQEFIFDRFRQAEDYATREYGGVGLGLSICKGLVALLGGTIRVESEKGKGSVFSVTFARK